MVDVSSMSDDMIIDIISGLPAAGMILLENYDVWRLSKSSKLIDFLSIRSKTKFLIQTLGITYEKLADNVIEFPVPFMPQRINYIEPRVKSLDTRYGYACLNNRQRYHRLILGYRLWEKNLLDDMVYTQNIIDEISSDRNNIMGSFEFEQILFDQLPRSREFVRLLPKLWKEDQKDFANSPATNDQYEGHDAFDNAFGFITTESEVEYLSQDLRFSTPTVTEKSIKPLLSCQIPILMAAPGVMKFLSSHGIDTFEDFVGADIDELNTEDRAIRIANIVKLGKQHICDFYMQNRQRILENFYAISQRKFEESVVNRAISFINDHL